MNGQVDASGTLSQGKLKSARILIHRGADVNVRDQAHSTPFKLASSSGSAEIVLLLIQHGADENAIKSDV